MEGKWCGLPPRKDRPVTTDRKREVHIPVTIYK
jgi:hypothetical protein